MSTRETIGLKPEPLLPPQPRKDRPLFIILAIMAFLSCLAVIAAQASFKSAGDWRADLNQKALVQILDGSEDNITAALSLISADPAVATAQRQSADMSRDLLKPWLGDVALPEDIPVPTLISLTLKSGETLDTDRLSAQLANKNITAEIDDFGRWRAALNGTSRAVQTVSVLAVLLLMIATISAAGFATQSALAARENVVMVLDQVGAQRIFVSKIFTHRFFKLGLKAGAAGALAALIILLLVWVLTRGGGGDEAGAAFLSQYSLRRFHIVILLFMPLMTAVICAISAGRTVLKTLQSEARS